MSWYWQKHRREDEVTQRRTARTSHQKGHTPEPASDDAVRKIDDVVRDIEHTPVETGA